VHPLERPTVVRTVERAASSHLGRPWAVQGFTDLTDRARHPAGIYRGDELSVFVKLDPDAAAGSVAFTAELRGLSLLRDLSGVATPPAVGPGVVEASGADGVVLLLEAIPEIPPARRTTAQWRSIGHALATLHRVRSDRFGLSFDGFFGPLAQDNRPVPSNPWADFYAQRRLLPFLRYAVDSGHLPAPLAAGISRLVDRLPDLCGPEPRPALLHGDAQQNNVLTSAAGAVLLDACPYFGHPEIDLALLDYFEPVPPAVFDAYREVTPIDPGFAERRELWRLHGYLAVVAVDGAAEFGRPFLGRIADALAFYR
jgi:fructosamine-3-kinase